MVSGSCLCGDIRFEVDTEGAGFGHCHCSMCRKAHGTGFVTWLDVMREAFRWTAGEERVARYRSSPAMTRTFCPTCGSPLFSNAAVVPGLQFVRAASLDNPAAVTPGMHIYCDSAQPWALPDDGLPRFGKLPG